MIGTINFRYFVCCKIHYVSYFILYFRPNLGLIVMFDALQLCCIARSWYDVSVVCLSVCNGRIVAKRCQIWPKLLLITNEKWHITF